uniref:Uncharacterized protein n=1 Tax=Minutocellus polymorphus TaxID=265543 RepID=A0A7S0FPL7_9STRA|mmetsp:Transcript_4309/g.7352  ORF Transcript_4309/g.7352 Transcript_4309/m.7352 type:complete len:107 (+) Transcript_4309:1-321(+)
MLVKDIADLLAKDSGQLEPSFDLYNFYLYLSSLEDIDEAKSKHYFNLAEKEGRAYTRMVTAEVEEHIQQFLDRDSNKPKNETEKTLKKPEKKEEEDNGPEIAVGYI